MRGIRQSRQYDGRVVDVPEPQQIMDALRGAGWLLEQSTADALSDHEFATKLGFAYRDPQDLDISRELDVSGFKQVYRNEDLRIEVTARVLAECKASTMPYVFVGRPLTERERELAPTEHVLAMESVVEYLTPKDGPSSRQEVGRPSWTWLGLHDLPGSPNRDTYRATQMTRLDRRKTWEANNRGIFKELVYPLAKALRAVQPARNQLANVYGPVWARPSLNFPIVVTTAPIYAVDVTAPDPLPTTRPWVTMTRTLRSRAIDGDFLIDVVNHEHLGAYLDERVDRLVNGVRTLVEAAPARFRVTTIDRFSDGPAEVDSSAVGPLT